MASKLGLQPAIKSDIKVEHSDQLSQTLGFYQQWFVDRNRLEMPPGIANKRQRLAVDAVSRVFRYGPVHIATYTPELPEGMLLEARQRELPEHTVYDSLGGCHRCAFSYIAVNEDPGNYKYDVNAMMNIKHGTAECPIQAQKTAAAAQPTAAVEAPKQMRVRRNSLDLTSLRLQRLISESPDEAAPAQAVVPEVNTANATEESSVKAILSTFTGLQAAAPTSQAAVISSASQPNTDAPLAAASQQLPLPLPDSQQTGPITRRRRTMLIGQPGEDVKVEPSTKLTGAGILQSLTQPALPSLAPRRVAQNRVKAEGDQLAPGQSQQDTPVISVQLTTASVSGVPSQSVAQTIATPPSDTVQSPPRIETPPPSPDLALLARIEGLEAAAIQSQAMKLEFDAMKLQCARLQAQNEELKAQHSSQIQHLEGQVDAVSDSYEQLQTQCRTKECRGSMLVTKELGKKDRQITALSKRVEVMTAENLELRQQQQQTNVVQAPSAESGSPQVDNAVAVALQTTITGLQQTISNDAKSIEAQQTSIKMLELEMEKLLAAKQQSDTLLRAAGTAKTAIAQTQADTIKQNSLLEDKLQQTEGLLRATCDAKTAMAQSYDDMVNQNTSLATRLQQTENHKRALQDDVVALQQQLEALLAVQPAGVITQNKDSSEIGDLTAQIKALETTNTDLAQQLQQQSKYLESYVTKLQQLLPKLVKSDGSLAELMQSYCRLQSVVDSRQAAANVPTSTCTNLHWVGQSGLKLSDSLAGGLSRERLSVTTVSNGLLESKRLASTWHESATIAQHLHIDCQTILEMSSHPVVSNILPGLSNAFDIALLHSLPRSVVGETLASTPKGALQPMTLSSQVIGVEQSLSSKGTHQLIDGLNHSVLSAAFQASDTLDAYSPRSIQFQTLDDLHRQLSAATSHHPNVLDWIVTMRCETTQNSDQTADATNPRDISTSQQVSTSIIQYICHVGQTELPLQVEALVRATGSNCSMFLPVTASNDSIGTRFTHHIMSVANSLTGWSDSRAASVSIELDDNSAPSADVLDTVDTSASLECRKSPRRKELTRPVAAVATATPEIPVSRSTGVSSTSSQPTVIPSRSTVTMKGLGRVAAPTSVAAPSITTRGVLGQKSASTSNQIAATVQPIGGSTSTRGAVKPLTADSSSASKPAATATTASLSTAAKTQVPNVAARRAQLTRTAASGP